MRRLVLMLGLVLAALVPAPVHAVNPPGCEVAGDNPDLVYIDWHNYTVYPVQDSWPGGNPSHNVFIDLWAYRESHDPGTGVEHCYRGYYGSAWTGDGSGGNFTAQIRARLCPSTTSFVLSRAAVWSTRSDWGTYVAWGPQGTANLPESVRLPSGATRLLYLADDGIFPIENGCLPDADTQGMMAGSPTWTTTFGGTTYSSDSVQGWFCHMSNGAVCY